MTESEFEIRTGDNSLFCVASLCGREIVLATKNSKITLSELVQKATEPYTNCQKARKPRTGK